MFGLGWGEAEGILVGNLGTLGFLFFLFLFISFFFPLLFFFYLSFFYIFFVCV